MPQYVAAREALRAGEIGPLVTIMAHLGGELETGQPTQPPPEEARNTVALIIGILESQAQGNARVASR